MQIAIVVAVANRGVMGKDNALPWHLPADLRHFKSLTLHKPVIMGRRTYESIGKPLPHRSNIIITQDITYQAPGCVVVNSLESALKVASELLAAHSPANEEVMIIGGAKLYEQTLSLACRLYVTEIHADVEGDTFFPAWSRDDWQEMSRIDYAADNEGRYPYSFVMLERK